MTLVKVNNNLSRTFDGMMKDLFNEFPTHASRTFREDVLNFPPVNIVEKDAVYQLELSVPGYEKADFNVKLDDKLLTISTEKKDAATESTSKIIRKEFSYKSFKRSFTLDEKIDAENISAKYDNGILTLELPKKENQKAAAKDINIQ